MVFTKNCDNSATRQNDEVCRQLWAGAEPGDKSGAKSNFPLSKQNKTHFKTTHGHKAKLISRNELINNNCSFVHLQI